MCPHSLQVEYPTFWSVDEFCDGFLKLMDHLELDRVSYFFNLSLSLSLFAYMDHSTTILNIMLISCTSIMKNLLRVFPLPLHNNSIVIVIRFTYWVRL